MSGRGGNDVVRVQTEDVLKVKTQTLYVTSLN